ncbi:Protein of unknown function [Gryllus bimaculatus]|nr:Protein of unknown function [Gryllus bimaculatus]
MDVRQRRSDRRAKQARSRGTNKRKETPRRLRGRDCQDDLMQITFTLEYERCWKLVTLVCHGGIDFTLLSVLVDANPESPFVDDIRSDLAVSYAGVADASAPASAAPAAAAAAAAPIAASTRHRHTTPSSKGPEERNDIFNRLVTYLRLFAVVVIFNKRKSL